MHNEEFDNAEAVRQMQKRFNRGKILGGLFLVGAGVLFLARELGADLPAWLFTWKTLLIALGLVAGAKRAFSPGGWMIAVLVGLGFLVTDLYPQIAIRPFLWPAVLIIGGLIIMFRPYRHRGRHCRRWQESRYEKKNSSAYDAVETDDFIESTTVFGGVKKMVFSKNFRGGDITNVMGGAEINLSQADFEGSATLEVTQVMGGTRLIVPAHWQIKSNVTAVLGSVEDKRLSSPSIGHAVKTLILDGTTFMGGIEIRSI